MYMRHFALSSQCDLIFLRDPSKPQLAKHLDADGLPYPGVPMREGDPLYCYLNHEQVINNKFNNK